MVWAGDGGTFDIGLQALSGAADRREDMLFVCYDNEAYMNTGIQQSSATPSGAWTTTTPGGKELQAPKKDLWGIIASHHPAYLATANPAYPQDFYEKFSKARTKRGFRFLHLLSVCPPGWKIDSGKALEVSRLAVETDVFPLLEMEQGEAMHRTYEPRRPEPVESYLRAQKRFRNMTPEHIEDLKRRIEARNRRLVPGAQQAS